MSIQHQYTQTVADGTATSVVRPSDWNSAHRVNYVLSGNTAGSASVSGLDVVLVGGNNLTLSADTLNSKVVFSAFNQSTQTQPAGNIAGTGYTSTTQAGSTVGITNNTAGLSAAWPPFITTFVQSVQTQASGAIAGTGFTSTTTAGTAITAALGTNGLNMAVPLYLTTQSVQTQASGNIAGAGFTTTTTAGTAVVGTHNSAGLSLGVPLYLTTQSVQTQPAGNIAGVGTTFAGTNISASMTLNTAGLNLALSAAAPGGAATATLYATGNTTQSSTGTMALSSMIVQGTGGVSAGISNGSIVISAPTLTSLSVTGALSASSNGSTISLGVGTVTASATGNTTQGSSGSINLNGLIFQGAGAASVGISNGSVVISAPSAAAGNVTFSAGTASAGLASLVFSNSNGVSFGLNGSTITASAAGGGGGGIGAGVSTMGNTAGTTGTVTTGNVVFVGTGPISLSQSSSGSNATISINAPATSSLVGASGLAVSTNGSTISVYESPGQQWEPFPVITGSAVSSHAPASVWFNRVYVTEPLTLTQFNVYASMSAQAGSATSVASTGTARFTYTKGVTIFSRQNTGTGSTNLTTLTSGSFGLTAGFSYSSTSQSVVVSWVTDSTGGTSSFNTTSNSSNWVSWLSGIRQFAIPMNATIQPGEYFIAHQHSSSTATTASNFTLASVSLLHIAPQVVQFQTLGTTGTIASRNVVGLGDGIASAITTNNTMPASVISHGTRNLIYIAASGF